MTDSDGGTDASRTAVRDATPDDALDVRRVLNGALLDVPDDLEHRLRAGEVLVSVDDGTVTGALVLDGSHVEAVAVRRRRRGGGIGGDLVRTAAERADGTLTADFRADIAPFYESLGFEVESDEENASEEHRLRGALHERRD
ncbi:GNAT family N-acetyltransferase [Halorarum halobium]|uniref:GNAT family N-acetyltransferase n=1 Tax=Halorarum halobium TaxID=3075121 RepID=UPI0028AB0624|nr:GNAT family N-acetyltransferase [Halobaculum sp. XH14]